MELQAVIGQLHIVNGVVQLATAVPGILAHPAPSRPARGRERDFLFVHLTLSGSIDETAVVTQDLLDAISQRFYQTSGSVTNALRQAIINANQLLLRLNLGSSQPTREGAITCAALHNGELFTLQVGEALAMIGHNYGIERLPAKAPDRITPVGRSSGLDIRYYHQRLQVGDSLLLADPRLANMPTSTFQEALVDTQVEYGLDALIEIVDTDSARLLLVEFADEKAPLYMADARHSPAASSEPLAVIPQPRREPREASPVPSDERRPQPTRPFATQPVRDPATTIRQTLDMEKTARHATSQAAMGLSRFTAWLAAVIDRLRTPTNGDEPLTNWVLPVVIAIMIPLLVGGVATGVYLQSGQSKQLSDLKDQMALNLGLGAQAGAEDEARIYYNTVLALAEQAERELRPRDLDVARLRAQARTALDELDDVTRLQGTLFYEYPVGTLLTAVVLQEGFAGDVYTLDQASGAVYQHQLDENMRPMGTDPLLLSYSPGSVKGNHIIGKIVDIIWRPAGSAVTREGLAMLDSSGALLTHHPDFTDVHTAVLGLSSEWGTPSAVTTYNERLYILDKEAGVIWKYFPSGDQFDVKADERTILLNEELNMAQVSDIAIYSVDGSLIVVYTDGRIRYYDTRANRREWDESILLTEGKLITPPGGFSAVKIIGRGLITSIFVADAANGRILQLNQDGRILAQYQATGPNGEELFQNIIDFAVAENPLRIFVVAENKLYLAAQE
jgi:hypothetical protein